MHRYVPKRIRTKSTTRHKLGWTYIAASVLLTLTLGSCLYLSGQSQACAPSASPKLPSTDDSVSPILSKPEMQVAKRYTEAEVDMVCQVVWGEARGCSAEEWALVVGCICNRADAYEQSIAEVVTAPYQFHGYDQSHPIDPSIKAVVVQTMEVWNSGGDAPVYPPYATTSEYLYFYGDGSHNWFREEY